MRYVIRNAAGLFLTGHESVGKHVVTEKEVRSGQEVLIPHKRDKVVPEFHSGRWQDACKFDTEQDARDAMVLAVEDAQGNKLSHLHDPAAFEGCVVCSVPDQNVSRDAATALAIVGLAIGAALLLCGAVAPGALAHGFETAMFIGPCYAVVNNGVSISTAITAVQYKAGTNGAAEILRASASQGSVTTSGQPAASLLRKTAAATVTTGVAGTTVVKANPINPTTDAALSTTGTGITASAEGTNGEQFDSDGFNDANGLVYLPAQEERPLVPVSGIVGVTFLVAPQSATRYARIHWRELRGS